MKAGDAHGIYCCATAKERGSAAQKKSKTCCALAIMSQDGFLPKSVQSTASTFVSNLCLLPRDGEP